MPLPKRYLLEKISTRQKKPQKYFPIPQPPPQKKPHFLFSAAAAAVAESPKQRPPRRRPPPPRKRYLHRHGHRCGGAAAAAVAALRPPPRCRYIFGNAVTLRPRKGSQKQCRTATCVGVEKPSQRQKQNFKNLSKHRPWRQDQRSDRQEETHLQTPN